MYQTIQLHSTTFVQEIAVFLRDPSDSFKIHFLLYSIFNTALQIQNVRGSYCMQKLKRRFSLSFATMLLTAVFTGQAVMANGSSEVAETASEGMQAAASASYSYSTHKAKGIELHIMQTRAENITFKSLANKKNLKGSGYEGINGGYFPMNGENKTFSIAIENGVPLIPASEKPGYSDGRSNLSSTDPRGTLVWNGDSFSVQKVKFYTEITGTNKNKPWWAQGGVSMNLGDSKWKTKIEGEKLPNPNGDAQRSAIVGYEKDVYLIVTNNATSASNFRAAIQDRFKITETDNGTSKYKGIFLDGSGSSQMAGRDSKGNKVSLTGDSRKLVQIITFKK
ncbi:hypothetical protein P4H70_14540 [Paenibacillus ehimensis]|uniref:hypothetical protein n=1 Tax=Paenibacillus ehimensis TaxID=79264 RepID=UPI002DBBF326|nr:hypothetical protein [Paenibacillus ehimensis]MEC0210152.1 hypothetical protein [Paenibacillus ehimensis]